MKRFLLPKCNDTRFCFFIQALGEERGLTVFQSDGNVTKPSPMLVLKFAPYNSSWPLTGTVQGGKSFFLWTVC